VQDGNARISVARVFKAGDWLEMMIRREHKSGCLVIHAKLAYRRRKAGTERICDPYFASCGHLSSYILPRVDAAALWI